MNLKEIQQKLYEKLKPSGWGDPLKMFLLSEDFYKILKKLYEDSQGDKKFTPVLKDMFKAFEECPYNELKVIIVGQDPYPTLGVADGIAFSCSKTQKLQPSLKFIYNDLEHTYEVESKREPDLTHWSNQGVLMLNTALSCQISKIGSHVDLWKPFTTYLFDMLASYNSGLLYVFLGKKAQAWHKHVPNINYKFFASHPASAAYNGGKWNSGGVWKNINKVLKENYDTEINWFK